MNILTFDIEEWFLEKRNHGNRPDRIKAFDQFLNDILDLLDELQIKATFFCVGRVAVDFPRVPKLIDSRGHEIGCHSNCHTWLNKMSETEVLQDTREAVDSLEQCIGRKILSYRAPAFSIGNSNAWAFEVLANCGIERDASVFPAARDFGGFPDFGHKTPVIIERQGVRIKEFPICTTSILGKEFAFSGGGYFRFFPYWFIKREIAHGSYNMCYFHISDLLRSTNKMMSRAEYEVYFKEPGSLLNRYKRYLKSNLGKSNAWPKLKKTIRSLAFINLDDADSIIDWNNVPTVILSDSIL